jgi:hypothetical protein
MMRELVGKSKGFFAFVREKGRLWLLVGGALLGVLLLLFGGAHADEGERQEADTVHGRVAELSLYEAQLEKEIKVLCEAVSGVGDTDVMVTFDGGYSVCYVERGEEGLATVGAGSSERAVFRRVSPPAVRGVGIVCRGGSRPDVQARLVELVSTALGISSSCVYITGK